MKPPSTSSKSSAVLQTQSPSPEAQTTEAQTRDVPQTVPATLTLDNYLHSAIKKYVRKVTRHETAVKQDKDPENLHQMRVGMRRLRTALKAYEPVLDLPKSANQRLVGRVSRKLGALRDLDVLLSTLERQYWPALPFDEQLALATVMQELQRRRQKAYEKARATLEGKVYQSLKKDIRAWLRSPQYRPLAQLPVADIVPEFIHPLLCQLWLHPGWLVGTKLEGDRFAPLTDLSPIQAENLTSERGTPLHDLRKDVKRVRYQLDFCSEWLGKPAQAELNRFSALQDALGAMQDSVVLEDFLDKLLGGTFKTQMPTFATILVQTRHRAWLDWQPLQSHYLEAKSRHSLHQLLLQ